MASTALVALFASDSGSIRPAKRLLVSTERCSIDLVSPTLRSCGTGDGLLKVLRYCWCCFEADAMRRGERRGEEVGEEEGEV